MDNANQIFYEKLKLWNEDRNICEAQFGEIQTWNLEGVTIYPSILRIIEKKKAMRKKLETS